jgi:hypothetical protein
MWSQNLSRIWGTSEPGPSRTTRIAESLVVPDQDAKTSTEIRGKQEADRYHNFAEKSIFNAKILSLDARGNTVGTD